MEALLAKGAQRPAQKPSEDGDASCDASGDASGVASGAAAEALPGSLETTGLIDTTGLDALEITWREELGEDVKCRRGLST